MRNFLVISSALLCVFIARSPAQAQASDAGINGKWHFVLQTPGGEREFDSDLAVDSDGNVTGKWGSANVAGTYKEGKLSLNFPFTSEEAGTTADLKIDGKLDDTAALAGAWAFSEYNGSFKATRPAATPAPDAAPAPDATPAPSDPKPNPPSKPDTR